MSDEDFGPPLLFLPHAVVSEMVHVGGGVPEVLSEDRVITSESTDNWLKYAGIIRTVDEAFLRCVSKDNPPST